MVEQNKEKFYTKKWFTLLSLLLFAPVGIFLLYKYNHFAKKSRIALSTIFGLIFIIAVFTEEEQTTQTVTSNEFESPEIQFNEQKESDTNTEESNSKEDETENTQDQVNKTVKEDPANEDNTQEQPSQTKEVEESTNLNLIDAKVERVIDGDTVKVNINGKEETLRLLLVDTPETVHPNKPVQPFGKEASDFAKETLNGKNVGLEIDVSERDKYGRLLVYLWLDGKMFNEMLLETGLARVAYVYVPNIKYVDQFREIQREAQEKGLGIWSIENYVQEDGFQDVSDNKEESSIQETQNNGSQNDKTVYIVKVDLGDEYFTIANNSDSNISLTGWKMVSIEGNQTYYFPDGFVLKSKTNVAVWSGGKGKHEPPSDLVWTRKNIWNNKGDGGVLFDAQGNEVDRK